MEPISKSKVVQILNITFNIAWYSYLATVILQIINFWYVSLKTAGEKLPYLEGTVKLREPLQAHPPVDKLAHISEIVITPELTEATVKVRFADWSDMLQVEVILYGVLILTGMLLGLTFIYQLHKIFNSLRANHVFDNHMIRRIQWMGTIIILGPVIGYLSRAIYSGIVTGQITAAGHQLINSSFLNSIDKIIMGFAVLVLAEVFKIGLQLQQEKELTI